MMTPVVVDLDLDGFPEVVFTTFSGNSGNTGILRAIRGRNGDEYWSANSSELALQSISGIAAANLDTDSNPEIVAISPGNRLVALNHDGTLLWRSSVNLEPKATSYLLSTPSIADLDGDGNPEIIVGAKAFNNQGQLLWDRHGETGLGTGTIFTVGAYGAISSVADLDRDGKPEVIAGGTAYRHDGELFWNAQLPDGATAIGNFDDDVDPEIVLVGDGKVYLLESDGRTIWGPIAIPGGGVGGAPTIADIDGDLRPEITVAGASRYIAIEHDGTIKWQATVQDQSSNVTGSTVFDLDGDGDAEVIYGDEKKLRVYDGLTGEVLFQVDKSSNTAFEMPIVVDVDADGTAEIVAVANTVAGHGPQKGILVFGNDESWVGTRRIWNQTSYHITNINDDGSIPRAEANSWEVYNNYRRNQQPTGTQFGVPLITASAANSRFTPGTTVLISGNAAAQGKRIDGTPNSIDLVTINGDAPDQIDVGGAYLSLIAIRPGRNDFEIVATDAVNQRTSVTLTLWGVNPPESGIDFSTFTDTTSSFSGVYGRTSFDEDNKLLFVDLATHNTGAFETQAPLLVGVKNISDPSVSVVGFDGFMPDGTPYFDYSDQVATGRLKPNENSRAPSIAFSNPNQIQFTYELVFLSQVNQAPAIQTLPKIEAFPGKGYSYDVNAIDPDADTLTYSLVSSPTGMAINATTGVITWQPSVANLGTVPVSVQVSDGRGGTAVQNFVISVTPAPPNRPPVITSRPVTNTNVTKIVETPTTNVDVSSWSVLTFQGTEGGLGNVPTTSPDWRIAPDGRSVKQLVNASASIFLSDFSFANQRTSGVWRVEDTGTNGLIDDDFIGFVFGYQDPQHFYLFDWKQRNQTSDSAVGKRGMNVRRIDADSPLNKMDLWNSDSVPGRTTSLYRNNIAWKNQTEYTFDLEFANGFIEIAVKEGETILDSISIEDDRYASGGFGFYNYSQGEVVYKGFVKRDVSTNAYRYDVDAVDADGDSVTYRLANGAPDGMAINRTNGLIEWSPTPLQVGDHQIVVEVIDGLGGIATQNFTICVHPDLENNAPIIISDPNSSKAQLLNPSFGDVSPQLITISNDSIGKLNETVSLRLPPTTIASKVDVFLLFDDTGSFTSASQILKDQFRDVIANLQQSMPNVDFAFGIGRFEDYNHPIANPNPIDRPFILNQPIVSVATPGFSAAIDSALSRTTPGCETSAGRCDLPESMLEGLYQVATGQGFDGNNDGTLLESGPAGLLSTQLNPGDSGDVPPFENFQADPVNHVLPAAGTRGGVGFRRDALPVILVATDDGTAYQPAGSSPITGVNGVQVPLSTLTRRGRPSTPYGNGANFQSTISALNELGAVVIGLGTNSNPNSAPRSVLEGISVLTGAVNQSTSDIASGIPNDPIEIGSPLYFQIALGTPGSVAAGIQSAINASVSDVAISIDVVLANASTGFHNKTGVISNARSGSLVSFAIEIEQGTVLENTEILFVRSGTTTILGSIPLSAGKGFEYTVVALDPDGDSIRYTLDQSPSGLLIDERSGVVSWQFPTQLPQLATVTASDGKGGKSSQTFRIEKSTGLPPDAGTQSSLAVLNRSFVYDMRVGRPDGQSNSYSLSAAPAGMTIHPQLGIIAWSPTKDQLGSHSVVVRIASASGSLSSEMLRITVSEPNVVPYITSIPQTRANVARSYLSNLVAQDADGDLLEFTLVSGPAGMSIQRNAIRNVEGAITDYSHSLTWTPATTQVGNQVVKLSVKDGRGGTDTQEFTISTSADPFSTNTPPSILSRPRVTTSIGSPYAYLPTARELDGDPLSWSLTTKPDGMSIDTVTGLITWSPTAQQLGNQRVVLAVSDGLGGIATQDFTIAVSNVLLNSPPIITSNPRTVATEGNEYQYNVVAEDSDYDLIRYTLEFAPRGMSIDFLRGTIRWQPDEEQLGEHQVIVRAADPMGGATTQQFSIDVRCGNLAPAIISIPPTRAVAQRTYLYAVRADDFEQDTLTYRLTNAPAGMTINASTGVIRWQPTLQQIRSFDVTVEAVDPLGAIGKQSYKVVVQSATDPVDPANPNGPKVGNRPPLIISTPDFTAASGSLYQYPVIATDLDGDAVTLSLTNPPVGMTIDAQGVIRWTPASTTTGQIPISIVATDANGALSNQAYILEVSVNTPPRITSTEVTSVAAGAVYRYSVKATDAENDPLTYSLENAPSGMTIDRHGLIRWQSAQTDLGARPFTVKVTDDFGQTASQLVPLSVVADTEAPKVAISIIRGGTANATGMQVDLGGSYVVQVTATDNVAVSSLSLKVAGVVQPLDSAGRATLSAAQLGEVTLEATATDPSNNIGSSTSKVQIVSPATNNLNPSDTTLPPRNGGIDPTDRNEPLVRILSPEIGSSVTNITSIVGTVDDPENRLWYWRLFYARADQVSIETYDLTDPDWVLIKQSTDEVVNGELGKFDPTALARDGYVIALAGYDLNGQGYIDATVIGVEGGLQLGNFQLSFTDLTIPLAGIPITVNRVYDTLNAKDEGDFGYGWKLGVQDARIVEIGAIGRGGVQDPGDVQFVPDKTKVYLTNPEGKRVGFTYKEQYQSGFAWLIGNAFGSFYTPSFQPDPGVYDTLTIDATSVSRGGILGAFTTGINPDQYTLTTKDGTQYRYDQFKGLEKITDRNGHTVTYSETGISHSSGASIEFVRDNRSRIKEILIPATGNQPASKLVYDYDAAGNLVKQTNQVGLTNRYEYSANPAHFLDKAFDPLGKKSLEVRYENRRYVGVFDGLGNEILTRELDSFNNRGVVRDANGNATFFKYDQRGNVLEETDPVGNKTRREYNDPKNPDLETRVIDRRGMVTEREYDTRGNVTTIRERGPTSSPFTEPIATRFAYDNKNNKISETNARGFTTTYKRDQAGTITEQTDASGAVASFETDSIGRWSSYTDRLGNVTRFDYNNSAKLSYPGKTILADNTVELVEFNQYRQITSFIQLESDGTVAQERKRTYDSGGRLLREVLGVAGNSNHPVTERRWFYQGNLLDWEITVSPESLNTDGSLKESPSTPISQRKSRITDYDYDAADRLIRQTDALGGVVNFRYDAQGNRVLLQDPVGNITTWTYDTLNRVAEERDPHYWVAYVAANASEFAGRTGDAYLDQVVIANRKPSGASLSTNQGAAHVRSFGYDSEGNQSKVLDRNNRRREFSYDHAGRLLTEQWFAANNGPLVETIQYTYDVIGNMLTAQNANSKYTYTYDQLNRLKSVDNEDGLPDTPRVILYYEYDAQGNVIKTSDDKGVTVQSTYSKRNQLETRKWFDADIPSGEAADVTSARVDFSYTATGKQKQIRRFSDLTGTTKIGSTDYTYDLSGRVDKLVHKNAVDALLSSYDYDYDFSGLLRDEVRDHSVNSLDQSIRYGYDLNGQLVDAAFSGQDDERFVYDANGNRKSSSVGTDSRTYTPIAANQLSTDGVYRYEYDGEGNLKFRIRISDGQIDEHFWDHHNMLVKVVERSASGTVLRTVEYRYDALGRRIAEVINGTITLRVVFDGDHTWADYSSSGAADTRYLFTGNIDQIVAAYRQAESMIWYNSDKLGTIRDLSNASGIFGLPVAYSTFGIMSNPAPALDWNRFGFTGRETMAIDNTMNYRARNYAVDVGHFISVDPIGFESKDFNLIRYVGNSPTNATDPTGEAAFVEYALLVTLILAVMTISALTVGEQVESTYVTVQTTHGDA